MCGIAGIFYPADARPVDPAQVRAMADAIAHRGPDGNGVWTAPGIGFGHRRLSIIDVGGGAQPMLTADGDVAITYNGEIYNYREVRAELEERGHTFRTESDTEVILAAWKQWGAECLPRLNGMFALALYDRRAETLFLARDRMGVKPLFFAELSDGALIFASELKGLLAHPLLRRTPNPQAVEDYLAFGYVPDDASIVAGVKKLAGGHYLLIRRGHSMPAPVRWWDLDFTPNVKSSAEELADLMRQAVRSRMVADVPLGAFLSGGVDSSAVVAFMAEASSSPVETCSIGFAEADHDETRYAAMVAERFSTHHRNRIVSSQDFELIDTLADAFDEPFADASAIGTYRVSELARETVTVALSGDGADEAFAGYRRYRLFAAEERVRQMLPAPFRQALGAIGDIYPKLHRAPSFLRAKTALQGLRLCSGEAYADGVGVTNSKTRSMLYRPDFISLLQGHRAEDRYVDTMRNAPADDALSRAQYADLKIWLPGDILTKVDRTSMAVSLEAREPLLDHRLVEFAARLPTASRLRRGKGKWLMRQALEGRLPHEILNRRKMGFVTPIGAWFRGPLAHVATSAARQSTLAQTGWFEESAMARIASEHQSGKADHGRLLWQLLMLDKSLQRIFGSA